MIRASRLRSCVNSRHGGRITDYSPRLHVEQLEPRIVLSGTTSDIGGQAKDLDGPLDVGRRFEPLIMAGDPSGDPADSPADRVDDNSTMSPYAGVGSLFMQLGRFNGFICTGTVIGVQHVLTAAHCLDHNNDGSIDFKPSKVTFNLNFGGDLTHSFTAAALNIHPDYTGFNNPSVNDDIAVIKLKESVPEGVPIYALHTGAITLGSTSPTLVGYGRSGNGVTGYTTDASFQIKRSGANVVDQFEVDDEGSGSNEVFLFDFDVPDVSDTGPLGGPSLGNEVETTLGSGDSGGPGLVAVAGVLQVATVNTFSVSGGDFADAPLFGSGGGGMIVAAYASWIEGVIAGGGDDGGGGKGGGGGNGGGPPCPPKCNSSSSDTVSTEHLRHLKAELYAAVAFSANATTTQKASRHKGSEQLESSINDHGRELHLAPHTHAVASGRFSQSLPPAFLPHSKAAPKSLVALDEVLEDWNMNARDLGIAARPRVVLQNEL